MFLPQRSVEGLPGTIGLGPIGGTRAGEIFAGAFRTAKTRAYAK
jgi:hypothetical protein